MYMYNVMKSYRSGVLIFVVWCKLVTVVHTGHV